MGIPCSCIRKKFDTQKSEEVFSQGLKGNSDNSKVEAAKVILRSYRFYKKNLKNKSNNSEEMKNFYSLIEAFTSNIPLVNVI